MWGCFLQATNLAPIDHVKNMVMAPDFDLAARLKWTSLMYYITTGSANIISACRCVLFPMPVC